MWQYGFPLVETADAIPSRLIPRKVWGLVAAFIALTAGTTDPFDAF